MREVLNVADLKYEYASDTIRFVAADAEPRERRVVIRWPEHGASELSVTVVLEGADDEFRCQRVSMVLTD